MTDSSPSTHAHALSADDLYLFNEGTHAGLYTKLGAHPFIEAGVAGVRFAVWAPNAERVSVVGPFNLWDGRRHPMQTRGASGIWELFIPGVGPGTEYKYEIRTRGGRSVLKADPYGFAMQLRPGNCSIVASLEGHEWADGEWMRARAEGNPLTRPINIYELHPGSWRRDYGRSPSFLNWRELADELIPYVLGQGYTHVELMGVAEHPFDGSWGYQVVGYFAPTARFGTPQDFMHFVDRCHQAGIGVIMDWVPAHFPRDEHGLRRFDGTALYEHADPRKGEHADWGTLIFNFGRREVINYLIGSALYWIDEFHVDALRVDAVASMLYLDYSREDGEWVPNEFGGNENLEAVAFLKRLNTELHAHGATSYAEESTAWPGVSRPVDQGGLGFTFKWNMGWMNDTLSYMSEDPVHRKYHHDKMTFGLVYAFNENFVLPLSHDEVVHGKRSLLGRMPGDEWQRFANLRAYLASMYTHPGKKLLFMGSELAPYDEWNHDRSLDWHLLEFAPHRGVQSLVRDLNALYRGTPALYEIDFDAAGFEWINWDDRDNSVLSWLRRDASGNFVISVSNLTPVVRHDFRIGVPAGGRYRELLTTDDGRYGGSGVLNGEIEASSPGMHGRDFSIALTLPPLATVILGPVS